jgi:hypothetical protein
MLISLITTSCASSKVVGSSDSSFVFFKGDSTSACSYLDNVDVEYTGVDRDSGFIGARDLLKKRAIAIGANALIIINYNVAITTFKLSAQTYSCSNITKLNKDTDTKFNIDDSN